MLSAADVRVFENCINRALYKIFGTCDRSSLDYLKVCVKLDGIKQLTERRHYAFIERLLGDCRFSNLLLMHVQNSIFSTGVCVGVWMCVAYVWLHSTVLLFLICFSLCMSLSCYSFNCVCGAALEAK